jgi:hypothetical protein
MRLIQVSTMGVLAELRQQLRAQDRPIALDRRGLATAVVLDVSKPLRGGVGDVAPVFTIPGNTPRRASSRVDRSQSSARRLLK